MSRLLNANFARLFKGKLFPFCALASVLLGAAEIILNYNAHSGYGDSDWVFKFDQYFFYAGGYFLLIIASVFVGIFVGSEHGGALRNKLIAGQNRLAVYLSELIVCAVGVLIIQFTHFASILVTGLLAGGVTEVPMNVILFYELLEYASLLGMCALFTAIAMLIPKKLAGSIASLLLVIGFYFVFVSTNSRLLTLEHDHYVIEGEIYAADRNDLTDAEISERNILRVVGSALPFGQYEQIRSCFNKEILNKYQGGETASAPVQIPLYSLGIFAAATAVGLLVFRKRDIN